MTVRCQSEQLLWLHVYGLSFTPKSRAEFGVQLRMALTRSDFSHHVYRVSIGE